ncbi:MAG: hypothetical protein DRN04_19360, partial [Thermoprotei archaeon]
MYLTREEEAILSGELGPEYQKAMKVLVKLGDALGAEKLIRIVHAHISGISYQNIGDAGLEFLEEYSKVKVRVDATSNPIGFDMKLWSEMNIPESFYRKQMRIVSALKRMGVEQTFTCTPYYIRKPSVGEHLAWGESNAVLYANSICGARTNREGGPSTVFAALIGKVPYMGMHVESYRTPRVLIKVEAPIENSLHAGVLGYTIGLYVKDQIPLITNIRRRREDIVKAICAGLGTSSSSPLFFIEKVSPEISETKLKHIVITEKVEIGLHDLENIMDKYSFRANADAVFLGCPHLSYNEIIEIFNYISKIEGTTKIPLTLVTSRKVFNEIPENVKLEFRKKNVKLICDTCFVVA